MSPQGRVSAVIPAHNRSHCIGRALESVLAQTRPPDEILVVDDASTDDLTAALAPYAGRIRCVRHETNLGAAAARNTGLKAASGDWIAFLDSDDAWHKDKLARQLDFIVRGELTASCTGFEVVTGTRHQEVWRPYAETLSATDAAWGCYTSPGSTLIVGRNALIESGGYDVDFARFEDWDLMLRLVLSNPERVGFLSTPLAAVYRGPNATRLAWLDSLDHMLSKHGAALQESGAALYGPFRSGLAFNRAGVYAGQGQWLHVSRELIRAWQWAPTRNWPFRVILGGRIRSALRKT